MQFTGTNITFTLTAPSTSCAINGELLNDTVAKVNAGKFTNHLVNAIQIDWCNATLPQANPTSGGSITIANSGQLLDLINEMQKEIYTLAAAVIALSNK